MKKKILGFNSGFFVYQIFSKFESNVSLMDKTDMAVAVFDKHAREYQQRFMDVSLHADSLDILCSSLAEKGADILELACGPGNITRYLLDKLPELNILATDLSANMLQLAKANNPEAEFKIMDCRNIDNLSKKFNAVVCGFCLPYLNNDETLKLIKDAAAILKEDGVLYISTIEGNHDNSGLTTNSHGDPVYMYYYEEEYLKQAMEKHFTIMSSEHKHYNHNGAEVKDIILVAIKKS